MVVGGALVTQLDIANEPRPEQGKTLTITFRWQGAAAKVVEQNVTSRLEALASAVRGVKEVSSVSRFGSGRITVTLKPQTDVSAAKFEIASMVRQIRSRLPEGVSYPTVTGGEVTGTLGDDGEAKKILTYQMGADMSAEQMQQIAEREIRQRVERMDGVARIEIVGTTDRYMEVEYDAERMALHGISATDITEAIRNYAGREDIVGEVHTKGGTTILPLLLSSKGQNRRFEQMPLKNVDGKIVYLNDLATCTIRQRQPDNYFRINGMNTIYINVYAEGDANVVKVAQKVKEECDMGIERTGIMMELTYDRGEEQMKEFRTLVARSSMTIAILLCFVWLCGGRRWRYLTIITVSLSANILTAAVVYWVLDIRLHPMSMAGITVSLGIIIDSCIVMADHYSYYGNRKVMQGIVAAMMTTVGALGVAPWLPEFLRHDLKDFSVVVMVNLLVAIIVAWLFTPALVEKLRFSKRKTILRRGWHTTMLIRMTRDYQWYVTIVQRRWMRVSMMIVFAGVFAASLKAFIDSLDTNTFRPKERETMLNIRGEMPVGGSVQELNEKVRQVEAFLSQCEGIERYETTIHSRGAHIKVAFTEEAQRTGVPYAVENHVIGKLITIGGADWATFGVSERGFSNSLNLQYRANRIDIAGYDYERLYRYAEEMVKELKLNSRVTDLAIITPRYEEQEEEFYMDYDRKMMAADSIAPHDVHAALRRALAKNEAGKVMVGGKEMDVVTKPVTVDAFDLWQLQNSYIRTGTASVRPSDVMDINRREAKNVIPREKQEYILRVAFNVLGSYTFTDKLIKRTVEKFNAAFPVGFRCLNRTNGAYDDDGTQYWLIGLVAVIIFFILSVMLESLRQALAITALIPVSSIGLFLTYSITGIPFGTGGYAAMVLLAGLTVNAGIYIVCQYNDLGRSDNSIRAYVASVNHKILTILLTILSTMLGMIPFLIDGHEEQPFWYSLAVGTIGGLLFSIIPLLAFLPLALRIK